MAVKREVHAHAVHANGPGVVTTEAIGRRPSLDDLAREQGVKPVARFDDIFGRGADLWDDDEDFENFLRNLAEGRRDNVAEGRRDKETA